MGYSSTDDTALAYAIEDRIPAHLAARIDAPEAVAAVRALMATGLGQPDAIGAWIHAECEACRLGPEDAGRYGIDHY